jgi:hypothetical protein
MREPLQINHFLKKNKIGKDIFIYGLITLLLKKLNVRVLTGHNLFMKKYCKLFKLKLNLLFLKFGLNLLNFI